MIKKRRRLVVENLQPRDLMTVESLAWDGASSLRLSFAPDGTQVGDQFSDADFIFSQSAAGVDWQSSVARAFQIWAQYANINVGIVPDSGDPIGALGPVRGDERFGEIRVAGIPMTDDTWAAAIDHSRLSASTWAGDILFNTSANWNNSPDDLLGVALHEAGHVLGLPHNNDPTSPMHTHGIPTSITPAASDIALLRQLYGTRTPDANEKVKANDTINDATRVRFSDNPTKFNGSTPLVHFGEIAGPQDRDVFFFDVPSGYEGLITIHAVSSGFSMLQYRFQLTDRDGNELDLTESTETQGGDLAITVDTRFVPSKLYLHVEPTGDQLAQQGSYAVVVELDDRITTSYDQALTAAQIAHRWFASSAQTLTNFDVSSLIDSEDDPELNSDGGVDDNPADAQRVEPYVDSALRRSARTIATITATSDKDSYRFRAPKPPTGKTFGLLVQVDSLQRERLIPAVDVLDHLNVAVPFEVIVDGNGQVILWVPNTTENQDYTVRIQAGTGIFATGNYELTATFQEDKPQRNVLVSRDLKGAKTEAQSVWYVARPQLFTLALLATNTTTVGGSAWANIYDQQLRSVATIATSIEKLRTHPSILLLPGTYYLQFGSQTPGALSTDNLRMELSGDGVTNPLGPQPIAPGSTPAFSCPSTASEFCYPNNVQTPAPFIVVPDPVIQLPTNTNLTVNPPLDLWFWNSTFLHTNATIPTDTSGDGITSPLDVLLIIDFINQRGSGRVPAPPFKMAMLDVNGDGFVAPIDVLLVIDALNRRTNGQSEGESGVMTRAEDKAETVDAVWAEDLGRLYAPEPEIKKVKRNWGHFF
jgi:Dockerin type I domain/Matrixin